jgi:hypothetical protein
MRKLSRRPIRPVKGNGASVTTRQRHSSSPSATGRWSDLAVGVRHVAPKVVPAQVGEAASEQQRELATEAWAAS